MAVIIDIPDLPTATQSAESIDMMVDGANAIAVRVAPCLVSEDVTTDQLDEARLILLSMIQRWTDAGSGAFTQQTTGPFGVVMDTRQKSSGYRAYPSEVTDLQSICRTTTRAGKAGHVDMWDQTA